MLSPELQPTQDQYTELVRLLVQSGVGERMFEEC